MSAATWALLALAVVVVVEGGDVVLRCPPSARCRDLGRGRDGRYQYEVDDHRISLSHNIDGLVMDCNGTSALDALEALPRARPALRVPHVTLRACPLPAYGTLAGALAAINVTLESSERDAQSEARVNLTLLLLPAQPQLAANYFTDFERLDRLEIFGHETLHPRPGFLTRVRSLRSLLLENVMLPPGELDEPPPALRVLDMQYTEGVQFMFPALEELHLTDWTEPQPLPLVRCDALRKLHLTSPAMIALPEGWLANCSRLEELDIDGAIHLTTLPSELLVGATTLERFAIRKGSLKALPKRLLDHSPNIHTLLLNCNLLEGLSSDTFNVTRRVRELDLSSNKLNSSALLALAPLKDLTELYLGDNVQLGRACGVDGYSPIRNSRKLKKLHLDRTNLNRICTDWVQDMTLLEELNLKSTQVDVLKFEDLKFKRTVKAQVELPAAPVMLVLMNIKEYNNAARLLSDNSTELRFYEDARQQKTKLLCNCRMYWTRRALDLALPVLQHVGGLRCADGRRLRDVPPEDFVCDGFEDCNAADLPDACACDTRYDDDPARDRQLVRVRCEGGSLRRVPRPQPYYSVVECVYELRLARNLITHLDATDIQPNIKGLDLRNNCLTTVDEQTAARLGDVHGMLRLAGNPLVCDCHAAPLLRALHARDRATVDWDNATCDGGSALSTALIAECPPEVSLAAWFAIALGVVLVFVVAAGGFLASRERRFFARAVLHRWGFVWRAAESAEDGRRYDAFLTFSHKDEGVARELLARLEPPYRLCVHHRDWTPGCYISEQVVESVRESRRTVALVSQHFLQSSWARAEFREAHTAAMLDARPRLIVVLLEEPATLQMDAQLRRYVSTHTYLRWGEPWFWHKLAVALPEPRAPLTPPEPTLQQLLPAPVPAAPVRDARTARCVRQLPAPAPAATRDTQHGARPARPPVNIAGL